MLYFQDLENILFSRHQSNQSDQFTVVSGYVQPIPVRKLNELSIPCEVYYGMYGEQRISRNLHNSLVKIVEKSPKIMLKYSLKPVHSKCYIWHKKGRIIDALIGSANFTSMGLNSPFREVLSTFPQNSYSELDNYLKILKTDSLLCSSASVSLRSSNEVSNQRNTVQVKDDQGACLLTLLAAGGETHNAGGLNWGQNPNNHTTKSDAYIPIKKAHIQAFPTLFPPVKEFPKNFVKGQGRSQRHNDSIEIIWDDGVIMRGLLEAWQPWDGIKYPKQISSFPNKNELGLYLRKRLGLRPDQFVTKQHLEHYGRTNVAVNKIEEGLYYFDFS
jgi:hypothetical protein